MMWGWCWKLAGSSAVTFAYRTSSSTIWRVASPVVATRTRGLEEGLASCPAAGCLVHEFDPHELAEAINAFATRPKLLADAQHAAAQAAETIWNGERERAEIVAEVDRALGRTASRLSPASDRLIAAAAR